MATIPKYVAQIQRQYEEDFPQMEQVCQSCLKWFQEGNSLIQELSEADVRQQAKCRYSIRDILFIVVAAALCGISSFRRIADFVEIQKDWFEKYVDLSCGVPDADSIRRIFNLVKPDVLEKIFQAVVEPLSTSDLDEHVAIDGKAVAGYFRSPGGRILHSVSAWLSHSGISLGQVTTTNQQGKVEGEYQAIPRLLKMLHLEEKTVTIDAGGCFDVIADTIISCHANYIIQLKGNQKQLLQTVQNMFSNVPSASGRWEKKHGRIENREYTTIPFSQDGNWSSIQSVTRVISTRKTDGKSSVFERYYISSLTSEQKERIATMIRSHWSIENNLHWSLDVGMSEDDQRSRTGNNVENLIIIRRLAISLLNYITKNKRTQAAMDRCTFDVNFRKQALDLVFE